MSICIRKSYVDVQEIIANPPPFKSPTVQTNGSKSGGTGGPAKSGSKREKDSSQGSKDSTEKRRQERFKKTRSASSRSVHFHTTSPDTGADSKPLNLSKKLLSGSCDWSPYGCHMHPDAKDFPKPNLDSLPTDPLTKGEQYYIDLAGNIRKGPVGKSSKCFCRPLIHGMERRLERDKQELIQHIDTAHVNLTEKICSLEKKTHKELVSLNEAVHQKLAHERQDCTERLHRTALKERIDSQRLQRLQIDELKGEVKSWLTSKLDSHRRSCTDQLDSRHRDEHRNHNSQNQNPYHSYSNQTSNGCRPPQQQLERSTSQGNVMSGEHHSHRPQQMSDELDNGPTYSHRISHRSAHICRSKSEMYLTGSVGTGSEDDEEDEDEGDDGVNETFSGTTGTTIRVNAEINQDLREIPVPTVSTTTGLDVKEEEDDCDRQPVYGSEDNENHCQEFERLGARPKQPVPLTIRTSIDTINEVNSGVVSELNSASSSLEMSVHNKSNEGQDRQHREGSDMLSADVNLSADLMKSLRCNGSLTEHSDSPFNDSGYRTKFSPSPREVPVLSLTSHHPILQHHSGANYPRNVTQITYPLHNQQHLQYGQAFDPPIGLPTHMPRIPGHNHQRKLQIPFPHTRPFNGPNSSLV